MLQYAKYQDIKPKGGQSYRPQEERAEATEPSEGREVIQSDRCPKYQYHYQYLIPIF